MRHALLLAALAPLAAFAQTQMEAFSPVFVTFRDSAQTLTDRWWKGGGSYTCEECKCFCAGVGVRLEMAGMRRSCRRGGGSG